MRLLVAHAATLALFWRRKENGVRVLLLSSPGQDKVLAGVARAPLRGWVGQASDGMIVSSARTRRRTMSAVEDWAAGSLKIAHLAAVPPPAAASTSVPATATPPAS